MFSSLYRKHNANSNKGNDDDDNVSLHSGLVVLIDRGSLEDNDGDEVDDDDELTLEEENMLTVEVPPPLTAASEAMLPPPPPRPQTKRRCFSETDLSQAANCDLSFQPSDMSSEELLRLADQSLVGDKNLPAQLPATMTMPTPMRARENEKGLHNVDAFLNVGMYLKVQEEKIPPNEEAPPVGSLLSRTASWILIVVNLSFLVVLRAKLRNPTEFGEAEVEPLVTNLYNNTSDPEGLVRLSPHQSFWMGLLLVVLAVVLGWSTKSTKPVFESMTHVELVVECKKRNIDASSIKEDLVMALKINEGIMSRPALAVPSAYAGMKTRQLKDSLKKRGLPTSGNKHYLMARLARAEARK